MRYLFVLAALGCSSIDTSNLPSTDGYQTWRQFGPYTSNVAFHGDTYRIVYANDVATTFDHGGRYPVGSVLVKESYAKTSSGGKGDLQYVDIMRKIDPTMTKTDAVVDDDWVFSYQSGSKELQLGTCYAGCHVQAPHDSAWIDYGD
jgi:hypothetical protein